MFTTTQIKEIARKLQAMGVKNSQFPQVSDITGEEDISVVQDRKNMNLKVSALVEYIGNTLLPLIQAIIDKAVDDIEEHCDTRFDSIGSSLNEIESKVDNIIDSISSSKEPVDISIEASPSDAEVMINGEVRSELTCYPGDVVTFRVSKNGYEPCYGSTCVHKSQTLHIDLATAQGGGGGGTPISLSPDTLEFTSEGGVKELEVSSSGSWQLS